MALEADMVRLARGANFGTVVTLMPSGQPQAQLRWVDSDGEYLLVNTEPQRQAARNLARDPRVTVLVRDERNPYDWAELRGRVVETVGGEEARAHIDALAEKYNGDVYKNPIGPEGRVILRIAADRVVTPAARR